MNNIEDIRPDLYKQYPHISPNLIDELIEIYFKEGKKAIESLEKPEIAFGWGTLKFILPKGEREVKTLETILRNRDTDKNTFTPEQLEKKKQKLEKMRTLYEKTLKITKEGKIERGRKSRKAFREKLNSNKENESQD